MSASHRIIQDPAPVVRIRTTSLHLMPLPLPRVTKRTVPISMPPSLKQALRMLPPPHRRRASRPPYPCRFHPLHPAEHRPIANPHPAPKPRLTPPSGSPLAGSPVGGVSVHILRPLAQPPELPVFGSSCQSCWVLSLPDARSCDRLPPSAPRPNRSRLPNSSMRPSPPSAMPRSWLPNLRPDPHSDPNPVCRRASRSPTSSSGA